MQWDRAFTGFCSDPLSSAHHNKEQVKAQIGLRIIEVIYVPLCSNIRSSRVGITSMLHGKQVLMRLS